MARHNYFDSDYWGEPRPKKKRFTNAMYVKEHGRYCPDCGSNFIDGWNKYGARSLSFNDKELHVYMECYDCDFKWVEHYKLLRFSVDKETRQNADGHWVEPKKKPGKKSGKKKSP